MNIVELAKVMENEQLAYSSNLKEKIIKKEWGIYLYNGEDQSNDTIMDCNMNYLLEDDWEIELPYVDFWTAWQAARDEGWAILWEKAETTCVYNNMMYMSPEMINGRWQILSQ